MNAPRPCSAFILHDCFIQAHTNTIPNIQYGWQGGSFLPLLHFFLLSWAESLYTLARLSLVIMRADRTSIWSCVFQTHLQTSEHTSSRYSCELIRHFARTSENSAISSLMHKQTQRCPWPDAGADEYLLHHSPPFLIKKKNPLTNQRPARQRPSGNSHVTCR